MHLRVSFEASDLPGVAERRAAHLAALPEPMAPLVDVMVGGGDVHRIRARRDGSECGYLVIGNGALLELVLDRPYWVFGEVIVKQAIDALAVSRAVVQQFDALLLSSCLSHQTAVRSLGHIARDYVPRPLPRIAGIEFAMRTATVDDLPAIRAVQQTVFTHPARLAAVIDAGHMRICERDGETIGFGFARPVGPDSRSVELGIAVDPPYRARGYAVYMLRAMIEHAIASGLRPIGGCAEDNRASRHMSERVGLVARYRLLELSFG